ncbi:hypothetical protein MUK42_06396 [Musa troglodytarum]|uniref:Uncharacterized protein n=1 Tax=Musa troglodytarum TaxID=320322 RepID=A0A9E7H6E8_9LILI|nr:hypothetical protein MUK42_06396 [Musa troglodytarum]
MGIGNNLRCCLACVLPCGALDVVRVVHLEGQVEEYYSRHVSAGDIMAANPDRFLTQPCSQGVARRTLVVPAESQLKRGHIYFLVPTSTSPAQQKQKKSDRREKPAKKAPSVDVASTEKKPRHRRRWSGRVGAWRPRLESVGE